MLAILATDTASGTQFSGIAVGQPYFKTSTRYSLLGAQFTDIFLHAYVSNTSNAASARDTVSHSSLALLHASPTSQNSGWDSCNGTVLY